MTRNANAPLAGLLLALLFVVLGCDRSAQEGNGNAPAATTDEVLTTFYPTTYFARRIAGDAVTVVCPVPEDADPIFWMPDDATIQRYQQAALVIINGAGFEKWVEKVSLPSTRVVDTALPSKSQFLHYEDAVSHSHGPEGEHTHSGLDGHTWVDPGFAKLQAREIEAALSKRWPEHRKAFEERYTALAKDLEALSQSLPGFAPGKSPPLLASHPAYNYVAKSHGWNIANLDLDPETMPDDATVAAITEKLKTHPAKVLLWESAPTPEIARHLEERTGLRSIVFSPCELLSAEDEAAGLDYLKVMQENSRVLRDALGGS